MRTYIKRGFVSFAISAFAGLLVNLIIDISVNAAGYPGFIAISPDFRALFPSPVIAAYVNLLLYGIIGFTFAVTTAVYDAERISFLLQSILYFLITSVVCLGVTMLLWQLQKYPAALVSTLAGYGATHVIMFVTSYKRLKKDINEINELI